MTTNNLVKLAHDFHAARAKCEELKTLLKEANAKKTQLELDLLEAMTDDEVSGVKIEGLGAFSMVTTNYLSVNAASKPNFFKYLKEAGHGGLLKEDVNTNTLTAFLKGHLAELTNKFVDSEGLSEFDASKKALEFLNKKGANYFSERGVSFRAK